MDKGTFMEAGASTINNMGIARGDRPFSAGGSPLLVLHDSTMWVHRLERQCLPHEAYRLPLRIPNNNRVILKLEHLTKYNPTGSLYDRLYKHLFRYYESKGYIAPGITPLLEGSVGNAGAAFASTAHRRGYKDYTVLLPKDIYSARIDQIRQLGAKVMFSPENTAELGYIEIMEEMTRAAWRGRRRLRGDPERLFPISKVLRVPNEPYARLVGEVVEGLVSMEFPRCIDYFLFGVGAGNTISETGKALKGLGPGTCKVIACEFQEHPFVALLKKGERPPVGGPWPCGQIAETISGVPLEKLNLDLRIVDDVMVGNARVRDIGRRIANEDIGLFSGRPTGGLISCVFKLARKVSDKNLFTIVFDSVAKYRASYEPLWDIDFANHRPLVPQATPQADDHDFGSGTTEMMNIESSCLCQTTSVGPPA